MVRLGRVLKAGKKTSGNRGAHGEAVMPAVAEGEGGPADKALAEVARDFAT